MLKLFDRKENNPFGVTGPQSLARNHYQVFGGRLPDTNIMPHLTSPTSNNGPDLLEVRRSDFSSSGETTSKDLHPGIGFAVS